MLFRITLSMRLPHYEGRVPWKYEVPAFINGKLLVFVVAVARFAIFSGQPNEKEIQISNRDEWNVIQLVRFWKKEHGVEIEGVGLRQSSVIPA